MAEENFRGAHALTLCWSCKRACGRCAWPGGCSWADEGIPVEGWEAKESMLKHSLAAGKTSEMVTYTVIKCPNYVWGADKHGMERTHHAKPIGDDSGMTLLAAEIVKQACTDYVRACKHRNEEMKDDLERFFRSEYFGKISELDPEALMRDLRQIAKDKRKRLYMDVR